MFKTDHLIKFMNITFIPCVCVPLKESANTTIHKRLNLTWERN